MLLPNATTLDLMLEAPQDPLTVLRICQARLIDARDIAIINFDEYTAAEQIREIGIVLGEVAKAMKAHALSPPFQHKRPTRKQIADAVAAIDDEVPF